MSKPVDAPLKSPTGAESPTTVRPLDLDDDDVQENVALNADANASRQPTVEDEPPAKPPRPLSPQQQAEHTLKEAFPSIDAAVVKAVLMASGGRVEPAFNALLGMSDPTAAREPSPPPQPPRPVAAARVGSTPQSQLESDEQYARQLAEHYSGGYAPRTSSRNPAVQPPRDNRHPYGKPNEDPYGENHSFLDDELPVIKENIRKGFLETQTTVNGWLKTLKKRIDGEEDDDDHVRPQQGNPAGPGNQQYRSRRSNDGRRSGEYNRYDADPQVLSDDFTGIQLNNDGSANNQRRSTRPLANPDLFKTTPDIPRSNDGRKVAFQSESHEDMDLYRTSPKPKENVPTSGKQSKWQPLSNVAPSPIGDNDNDPFSLGDSEDEKESKDRVGGKEIRQDDAERLKKAAAEAMNDSIGEEPAVKPEPAETVGTKDKIAEQKLTGKS